MIEILKEVTDWGDHVISNGYYHVNRQTQLVAYQAEGGELKIFNKPMKHFSKSRRKFVKIGDYQEKGSLGGVAVQGSNGTASVIDALLAISLGNVSRNSGNA